MKHSNISVGLDIGTTKIVAMVGTKNEFNKVEILGVGKSKSLGVHRGVVNNITQTIQSIQQAVEEAKTAFRRSYRGGGCWDSWTTYKKSTA